MGMNGDVDKGRRYYRQYNTRTDGSRKTVSFMTDPRQNSIAHTRLFCHVVQRVHIEADHRRSNHGWQSVGPCMQQMSPMFAAIYLLSHSAEICADRGL